MKALVTLLLLVSSYTVYANIVDSGYNTCKAKGNTDCEQLLK